MSEAGSTFTVENARNLIDRCDTGELYTPNDLNFNDAGWEWDRCFTAEGVVLYDPERAVKELLNLMGSQHSDGMIPHMVYRSDMPETAEKGLRSWGRCNGRMPEGLQTSAITQPPIIAATVRSISEYLGAQDRANFLRDMFGRLVSYHEWFLDQRDHDHDGVVSILHPWESGMDNNFAMQAGIHPTPEEERIGQLRNQERRDVSAGLDSSLRTPPGALVALEGLVGYLQERRYDWPEILSNNPKYAVDSVAINAFLLKNTADLAWIGAQTGRQLPAKLQGYLSAATEIRDYFWDDGDQRFYDRHSVTKELIKVPAISNVMPLVYPEAMSGEQLGAVRGLLTDETEFGTPYIVPSLAKKSLGFHPFGYWNGPLWPFMNLPLFRGAVDAGEPAIARGIRRGVVEPVSTYGANEHYSPIDGRPGGARNFVPSAAIYMALDSMPEPR